MSETLSYDDKNPIIWILGPPSSGKFTQYKEIVDKYDCTAINSRHLPSPNIMFIKGENRNRLEWEKVKEDLDFKALEHSLKATLIHHHDLIILENYPKNLKFFPKCFH